MLLYFQQRHDIGQFSAINPQPINLPGIVGIRIMLMGPSHRQPNQLVYLYPVQFIFHLHPAVFKEAANRKALHESTRKARPERCLTSCRQGQRVDVVMLNLDKPEIGLKYTA